MPEILPKSIQTDQGTFVLVKRIHEGVNTGYKFAKYSCGGKRALAKYWIGGGINRSWLINEMTILSFLNRIGKVEKVGVPSVYSMVTKRDIVLILIEEIQGGSIREFDDKAKIKVFQKAIKYLAEVDYKIKVEDRERFMKRGKWFFVVNFIFSLAKACLRNPEVVLVSSLYKLFLAIPTLIKEDKTSIGIVHRDLTEDNILVANNNIFLIDFQYSCLSFKIIEKTNILLGAWQQDELRKKLLESLVFKNDFEAKENLFAFFLGYQAVCDLASGEGNNSYETLVDIIKYSGKLCRN